MKTIEELLSHPIRERVLAEVLKNRPASAVEISRQINIPLSTIAYHIRDLADASVIVKESTRPRRGATETFYVPTSDGTLLEVIRHALEKKIADAELLLDLIEQQIGEA